MIITQIIPLLSRQLQPMISLPLRAQAILTHHIHQKQETCRPANPHHPQTNPIARGIARRLRVIEDITRNQPAAVPEPDLKRRRNRLLVVPAHVVAQPAHQDRLRQISAAGDGEDGKVARAHRHRRLAQQNHVSDRRDETARQREEVPMAEAVAEERRGQRDYRRDDVHGDAHDLGADGGVAELVQDGGREEGHGVAGVDDAKVH